MATGTRKHAQYHLSSGTCKSKLLWKLSHTVRTVVIKKAEIENVGKYVEKREPLCTVGGTECKFFKKLKLSCDPAILLLGILSEENKKTDSKRYMHPLQHYLQ